MKVINKIKDGYLHVIDWVEAHPHWVFWGGVVGIVAALFV